MTDPSRSPAAYADHVIGLFPREALSSALASTHRAGFGAHTRVLDGARGDAVRQLERTGLRIIDGEVPTAKSVLIVVTAPGRTGTVADLFARLGAEMVMLATRGLEEAPTTVKPALLAPDVRIGGESELASDA